MYTGHSDVEIRIRLYIAAFLLFDLDRHGSLLKGDNYTYAMYPLQVHIHSVL